MNSKIIAIIALVILGAAGYFIFSMNKTDYSADKMVKTTTENEKAAMMAKDTETTEVETDEVMMSKGTYIDYSETEFQKQAAQDGQRLVLFFYASWCPTCRPADAEFKANLNKIPQNVTLFKVNYDTETELKKKYGITYQHTFVQVDAQGNEITKWNGGSVDELNKNLK